MNRAKQNRRRNPLEGELDLGGIQGPEADEAEAAHLPAYVEMATSAPAALAENDYEQEDTSPKAESNGPLLFLAVAGGLAAAWYWWSSRSVPSPEKVGTVEDVEEDEIEAEPSVAAGKSYTPQTSATAPRVKFQPFIPRVGAGPASADPRTAMQGTRMGPRTPSGRSF